MRARKSPDLISPADLIKLMTLALMGAALGPVFGLVLTLSSPAVANLLHHGGGHDVVACSIMLMTTFAIGTTLTAIMFVLAEDK